MRKVRCPKRNGAILVAEMDHRIVHVLGHRGASTKLGTVLDKELARRSILVFEVARITLEIRVNSRILSRTKTCVLYLQGANEMAEIQAVLVQCGISVDATQRRLGHR